MEVNPKENGVVAVELAAHEVRRLRVALQRALFEDVPPQHLGPALDFAEVLLKALDGAAAAGEGPA
ncbi:MAG: hypothetical protein ACYTGX_00170 [Planctomycetota bacterium]|jgi:hypothetical protein